MLADSVNKFKLINLLPNKFSRSTVTENPEEMHHHYRDCMLLQRVICLPLSCSYAPGAHFVLPYVKTHVMDKIYAKGISLSAEPKPVHLWSCARAEPAHTEEIPGVFPVVVVQFISLLSHVRLFGNPTDCCSPSGSSVHGILQARILEWVAISFSKGISPIQGSNPCLLHWQADSLPLSHQGSSVFPVVHA